MSCIKDGLTFRCVSFIAKCISRDNGVVRAESQHGVFSRQMRSPSAANVSFCCNYFIYLFILFMSKNFDVFLRHIVRINKQFVWRVHQQTVIIPKFNKINVIKELLSE